MSGERLMKHVNALTIPKMAGRGAGTEGEKLAAGYAAAQLEEAGVAPAGTYLHPFPFEDGKSVNVVGTIAGRGDRKNEHVILGAHIDHLGTKGQDVYHGAEDNASGVAVVLEIAFALAHAPETLDRSVTVVLFGAEEEGLVGSRAFARNPPVKPMKAMVNIDMIGRDLVDQGRFAPLKPLFGINDRRAVGVVGTRDRPVFRTIVERATKAEKLRAWAPEDLPGALSEWAEREAEGRGDSYSFEAVGVPALFFGQGESDDYHKPTDIPDKLVPVAMAARARAIRAVVVALSKADLSNIE
jgi:Zn-dependent M28 family amino/carboxypeptidase